MRDKPSEYLKRENVFIGCEGGESGLDYQISRAGNSHFLFASDFPHEIGPEDIMHEIEEVQEYPGLSAEDKVAILGGNARRFYRIQQGQ
jgi:predicted TIM-barrel fold metal-dependent hydrolase